MEDLWPDFDNLREPVPPAKILREQAALVRNKTEGLVTGEVIQNDENSTFSYLLALRAPYLNNYALSLVKIEHEIDLYPVEVVVDITIAKELNWMYSGAKLVKPQKCVDEEEFKAALSKVFFSRKVVSIIGSLVAQSRGLRDESNEEEDPIPF